MARRFDEVMIVNPTDGPDDQGARRMRFHQTPGYGYFAEEPYGYYAEDPYGYAEDPFGYYAEDPYGEDPYGEYAEDPYGEAEFAGYAEDPYGEAEYGWYAEPQDFGAWGQYGAPGYGAYAEYDPVGYYAEEPGWGEAEYAAYAEDPYGEDPGWGEGEMVGYSEYEPLSGPYAEAPLEGYVRDRPSRFNAGCAMPANVDGYEEAPAFEGYTKPSRVSPRVDKFSPPDTTESAVPDTFKPHW